LHKYLNKLFIHRVQLLQKQQNINNKLDMIYHNNQ
jgi:hypothetical protein